jgi:3-hydroxybutyryl-CoA dehydratase
VPADTSQDHTIMENACFTEKDWLGKTARRTCQISKELVDRFVELSGDSSPLHTDDAAAQSAGFRARLVHGMLLGSLVSSVIGTQLPGEVGFTQEVKLSFRNPCYEGDDITIDVAVSEFHESLQLLFCKVEIRNGSGQLLAVGQWRSGLIGGNAGVSSASC